MNRLRRWNARANAWLCRHPWGYSVIYATVFVVLLAIIQREELADLGVLLAGGWVLLVLVGELARRWRERNTPSPRSHRALRDEATDEGGRWRQGLP